MKNIKLSVLPNVVKVKLLTGIKCPKCNDRVFSFNRHDFRWCKCGNCAVDGGDDYFKFSWGKYFPEFITFCEEYDIVKIT